MQPLIGYEQSAGLVREVYDNIRATRKTIEINNFWKAISVDFGPILAVGSCIFSIAACEIGSLGPS